MPRTVIKNGTIIDGTGAPAFRGDVVIEHDRIAEVREGNARESPVDAHVVDATGLAVTPGFIDIHSHSDHALLSDPRAFSSLTQGVTLEIVGNCGYGCFPIGPDLAGAKGKIFAYHDSAPISWTDADGYFRALEERRPGINVASLVPNGQLRVAAMGPVEREATRDERRAIVRLLEASLEQGAWGLSTGLEYGEESFTTEDELQELSRSVAAAGAVHACHPRDRDDRAAEAIDEVVDASREFGTRLQISHLIPNRGLADLEACLRAVERARDEGLDISFDMHTRLFGIGYLSVALPPSSLHGDPADVRARLASDEFKAQVATYRSSLSALGDWSRVLLLDNEVWPDYGRRTIAEIAAERVATPMDAVCDLLAATADDPSRLWASELTFTEAEQRTAFAHRLCMPASDAAASALDGPLADLDFHGAFSWAAWFYGYAVRNAQLLTAEEAVHKLTGQPAAALGVPDRGALRPGAFADIAVFAHDALKDHETMFEPNRPSTGIEHVLVNGRLAVEGGRLTDVRSGSVLRR